MRKESRYKDVDRISELPGNIKDTILSCMPLRDAVRSSILSRRWRYNYVQVPKLVFDDEVLGEATRNQPSASHKFISIIYQVLLLHRGPVKEFELTTPPEECFSDIDRFITYLSWKAIENFTLHVMGDDVYTLPSSFYSCLQLKDIMLEYCTFKPPPNFQGFSRLTILKFYTVTFQPETFGSFISNCLLLERLIVVNNEVPYYSFTIDAPKLKYLHMEGFIIPIRFKSAPLLEALIILPTENEEASAIELKKGEVSNFELFRRLPSIDYMKTNYLFLKSLKAGSLPVKHVNISIPLKELEIVKLCFDEFDEVSCALDIIRSSTKLQKIVIRSADGISGITDPVLEYLKAQVYSDISLDHLREVNIESLSESKVELEFIKLLLATSPILEEISIEPYLLKVADRGFNMLRELLQFERASRKAKITIKDPV